MPRATRWLFVLLVLAFGVGAGADAPADVAAQAAIHAVIGQQIEAFRHDDAPGAYALASPHIQALFGSADGFMAMVKRAYQPVYRPQSVTFGALATEDGKLTQTVQLVGPDGRAAEAHYTMEREPDGSWRIDGCTLTLGDYVGT
jgi:hypothetical protein